MKESFINKILEGAKEGYLSYGILPSLILAQAILESGWGRSDLATKANNLFGIKVDKNGQGEKILIPTKEFISDKQVTIKTYFRKYKSLNDSILDHAEFLNKIRYLKVIQARDYKEACREIYKAGYATDPNYTNKLIKIIEENKLYKYDTGVDNMKKVMVLDPGHGGTDPGATANGYKEKDLALKLCLDVEKKLKPYEDLLETHLTRRDDRFISLEKRCQIANSLNADAFLSKHLNSAFNNSAKGTETFNFKGSVNGKKLATIIQNDLVSNGLTLANRGVKEGNFYVLKNTKMPSTLLETCFINNKEDLDFLLNNWGKFVDVVSLSILKYFNIKPMPNKIEATIPQKPKINIVEGKINLLLIGEHVTTEGFIKDGTNYVDVNGTYISIREILENMQLKVGWDNDLRLITADTTGEFIKEQDLTDVILIGNKINVKTYKHKGKHCLKIKSAYIPIRDIYESLGFKVEWESKTKSVVIK